MTRHASAARLAIAFLALLALVRPAAAGDQVPFKGGVEATTVERRFIPGNPPHVFILLEGTGHASHLGQFTYIAPHFVNTATGAVEGIYEFTAANGDMLFADFTAHTTPIPGTTLVIVEDSATITGGTGRFAGATGSFTAERIVDTAAGTTEGSFEGTISSVGSASR
jgi:hypothetical protein